MLTSNLKSDKNIYNASPFKHIARHRSVAYTPIIDRRQSQASLSQNVMSPNQFSKPVKNSLEELAISQRKGSKPISKIHLFGHFTNLTWSIYYYSFDLTMAMYKVFFL